MSEHKESATKTHACGRGEELVAYLYGEATKEEAAFFSRHLEACAACREELEALGGVRAAVGVWRAEALDSLPSLNIEEALAPSARTLSSAPRVRSARAALREFFSLSPLWLRAGAFAAVLAVCALLVLTLARAGGPEKVIVKERVEVPVQSGYTEEQVNALVAQKVAEAKAEVAAELKNESERPRPEQVINAGANVKSSQPTSNPNVAQRKRTPRRTSNREDSLLAEDNLPRLSDLLSGSY